VVLFTRVMCVMHRERDAALASVSDDDISLDSRAFDNLLLQDWSEHSSNVLGAKVCNAFINVVDTYMTDRCIYSFHYLFVS
jgi:hypothetical protein